MNVKWLRDLRGFLWRRYGRFRVRDVRGMIERLRVYCAKTVNLLTN
jgi:hypothetical protein